MIAIPYSCPGQEALEILGAPFADINYAYSVCPYRKGVDRYCHVSENRSLYESVNPSEELCFTVRNSEWESPVFYFVPDTLLGLQVLRSDLDREGEIEYSQGGVTRFFILLSANYYQEVAAYSPGEGFLTVWGDIPEGGGMFAQAWRLLAFMEPPCPPSISLSLAKEMDESDHNQNFYSLSLDQEVWWWFRGGEEGGYFPCKIGDTTLERLP